MNTLKKSLATAAIAGGLIIGGGLAPAAAMPGPGSGSGYVVANTSTNCEAARAEYSSLWLVTPCKPGYGGYYFSYRSPF